MNKIQIAQRRRSVAAAVGSVRAEGLNPSVQTQKQLQSYADGKISARTLRSNVAGQYLAKSSRTK